MRTLKFKPQPTAYVFRCRQSSKRTSRETEAHFSWVKRSRLSVVIGRFRSILFVSVFQGSLAVAIIMIDGSEKKFILKNNEAFLAILFVRYLSQSSQFEQQKKTFFRKNSPTMIP